MVELKDTDLTSAHLHPQTHHKQLYARNKSHRAPAECEQEASHGRKHRKHLHVAGRRWWFSFSVVSSSRYPVDCSRPGSSVHGILWARILEWAASSRGLSCPSDSAHGSCVFCVGEWVQFQVPITHVIDDLKCSLYWLSFLPFHTSPLFQQFLKSSPRSSNPCLAFKSLSYNLL